MNDIEINKNSIYENFDLEKINKLPEDILREINQFIPKEYFINTNKQNFTDYHYVIKPLLLKKNLFESYVRDMVRRDNDFIFKCILHENYDKWILIKKYNDDYVVYADYVSFLINYCIIHNSNRCRIILTNYIQSRKHIVTTKYKKKQYSSNIFKYTN
jgi:hypothetical protein